MLVIAKQNTISVPHQVAKVARHWHHLFPHGSDNASKMCVAHQRSGDVETSRTAKRRSGEGALVPVLCMVTENEKRQQLGARLRSLKPCFWESLAPALECQQQSSANAEL